MNSKNKTFYKMNKRLMMDFDSSKDYYKILGVDAKSTDKQIKEAYHKLAKKYHPDLNGGKTTDQFKEMSAAYDILSDPSKRKLYDETRGVFDNPNNHYHDSYANQNSWTNQYSDRFYRANNSTNNTSSNFNKGSSGNKSTYTFRDPKTGEYKTYTYEGDMKGNPFFKDFEDLLKQFNGNSWAQNDKTRDRGFNQSNKRENPFNSNFDKNFHDPYNHYRSNQNQDPFQNQREKWNPNWQEPDYHSLLWARKFFLYFLMITFCVWIMTRRRTQYVYINEAGMPIDYSAIQSMPYQEVRRVPYPPKSETVYPAFNMPGAAGMDDPYVNPSHSAFKR